MFLARATLILASLMFGVLGMWLLLAPGNLDEWLGIIASTAAAKTELRAIYGGLELGLAGFLLVGVLRPRMTAASCLCLGMVMAGLAVARGLGLLLDGSTSGTLVAFLASEVLFAVLGFVGFALASRE